MTGLRIGELLALRWQDVDLQKVFITVRQRVYEGHFEEPKSKRSKRSVPLGPQGIELLTCLRPLAPIPRIWCSRPAMVRRSARRNLLNRQLKPVCRELGLRGANLHWLRHANATMLDAVGAPLGTVQALLGHSSSDVTRDTYIHAVPADARRAVEEVERLIGPKWTPSCVSNRERQCRNQLILRD